jgi:hypothetical protein
MLIEVIGENHFKVQVNSETQPFEVWIADKEIEIAPIGKKMYLNTIQDGNNILIQAKEYKRVDK